MIDYIDMNKQIIYNTFAGLHADAMIKPFLRAPAALFYHGVAENPDVIIETESISADEFRKQMEWLKKNRRAISATEFEERFKAHRWEGDEVLLTFDDGYQNMLTTGLPILEEYGFPFLLFLTTNNITHGSLFPTTINRLVTLTSSLKVLRLDGEEYPLESSSRQAVMGKLSWRLKREPQSVVEHIVESLLEQLPKGEIDRLREQYPSVNPMTWDEARQIAASELCTIGSHGVDHICCHDQQPLDEVKRNLRESKLVIEKELGLKECRYFSYPNGNFTEDSNKLVAEAGYAMGFSTKRLPVHALTQWNVPRLYVPYNYPRFVFAVSTYPKDK